MSIEMSGCFSLDVNSLPTHVVTLCDTARVCDSVFSSQWFHSCRYQTSMSTDTFIAFIEKRQSVCFSAGWLFIFASLRSDTIK